MSDHSAANAPPGCDLDHLVVAAASLAQGVRWCEATLGVTPASGGVHALMGTHNRLLQLSSPAFPLAYLEIIAIDPAAPPPGRARWFGLDDPALQAALHDGGPRLVHAVARCAVGRLDPLRQRLQASDLDLDPGTPIAAERDSAAGRLKWRITVRDDGRLLAGGALPTLIEWDSVHPASALPDQGLRLLDLQLSGVPAAAMSALGLRGVRTLANRLADSAGAPAGWRATLATPHGQVVLGA